jgi:hypothetical protein
VDMFGAVSAILGGAVTTKNPDEDEEIIVIDGDYITLAEMQASVQEMGMHLGGCHAMNLVIAQCRICHFEPIDDLTVGEEQRRMWTLSHLQDTAYLAGAHWTGLDRPYYRGDGAMFSNKEQGEMLTLAFAQTYVETYIAVLAADWPEEATRLCAAKE